MSHPRAKTDLSKKKILGFFDKNKQKVSFLLPKILFLYSYYYSVKS